MKFYKLDKLLSRAYEKKAQKLAAKGDNYILNIDDISEFKELDEREVLILVALKKGFDLENTNEYLKKHGYGKLYAKLMTDAIWIYAINNNESISVIIEELKKNT